MSRWSSMGEEEDAIPTWLKEGGKKAERKPLFKRKPSKNTSNSNSNSNSAVEEDYGGHNIPYMGYKPSNETTNTSWAEEPSSAARGVRALGTGTGAGGTVDYGSTEPSFPGQEEYEDNQNDDHEDSSDEYEEYTDSEEDEEGKEDVYEEDVEAAAAYGGSGGDNEDTTTKWSETTPIANNKKKRAKTKLRRKKSIDTEGKGGGSSGGERMMKKPHRSCCHSFFITVQIVTILANLTMIAIQVLPIIMSQLEFLDIVLRGYFGLFSLYFIITELEWFGTGGNWMVRGFLHTFLGTVAMEQHVAMVRDRFIPKEYWSGVSGIWTSLLFEIGTWWIIGVGGLYFLMGLFCLKRVRNRCREQYQAKLTEFKENMMRV